MRPVRGAPARKTSTREGTPIALRWIGAVAAVFAMATGCGGSDSPGVTDVDPPPTPTTFTLTTSVTGSGTISPSSGTYQQGARVELSVAPAAGWQFSSWGGDASGAASPLTLTMNANKNVTATFQPVPTVSRRIVMSVGPRETCWRYELSGCELVQFDYDLGTRAASRLSTVVAGGGTVAPAFSPDGTRLAYDGLDGRRLTTRVLDLGSRAIVSMESGSNKPTWLDADFVAFGAANISLREDESFRWSDMAKQRVPGTSGGGTVTNPNAAVRILGASNSETGFASFECAGEDPWPVPGRPGWVAFHSPVWRFEAPTEPTVEHTCPWLVGLDPYRDRKDPRPVVINTDATAWEEGITWERVNTATAGITGCAHVSVAPSGQRFLCTNQPEVTTLQDPVDGATTRFNDIYGFDRVGTTWVSTRAGKPLFEHLPPRGLPDIEEIWSAGKSCHVYRTKQGGFCGADDLIVTDVYCEDTSVNPANPDQVFARAFLIDIRNPEAPTYMDLTSALEDASGLARGALGSYTLTCAAETPAAAATYPISPAPER